MTDTRAEAIEAALYEAARQLEQVELRMDLRIGSGKDNVAIGQHFAKEIVEACRGARALLSSLAPQEMHQTTNSKAIIRKADEVCAQIFPLLAGLGPQIQGIVLADLLARWIAGHDEAVRDAILRFHFETVRDLVPLNARDISMPD